MSLQALNSCSSPQPFLHQHLNTAWAQPKQCDFGSGKKSRQDHEQDQQEQPHQKKWMGVARIELALGEL